MYRWPKSKLPHARIGSVAAAYVSSLPCLLFLLVLSSAVLAAAGLSYLIATPILAAALLAGLIILPEELSRFAAHDLSSMRPAVIYSNTTTNLLTSDSTYRKGPGK